MSKIRIVGKALRNAAPRLAEIVAPGSTSVAAATRDVVAKALPVLRDSAMAPLAWVGSWYAYAAASDPDALPYDTSFWRAGLSVAGASLGTWLTVRRSMRALPVMAATAVASALAGAWELHAHDAYVTRTWPKDALREQAFNRALAPTQAALAAASVASAALLRPSRLAELPARLPAQLRALWPQARRLALYYMPFTLLGHWGEMLFCTGIKYGLIRGGYDRENHMLWDQ
jgi:hypothetical protein